MSCSLRAALLVALLAGLCASSASGALASPVAPLALHLPLLAGGQLVDPDLAAVAEAARGLLYPSEIDAPLAPFSAPREAGSSPAAACASLATGRPLLLADVEAFLGGPARVAPWMSAEELATAARFAELRRLLLARLADPVACRVGGVEAAVYLIGRSAAGAVVGLRTVVVET